MFYGSNGNGFGDIWWTDNPIYFSSIDRQSLIVQELYDFSRNKLQQKVSQRFLVNGGVLYDILKV